MAAPAFGSAGTQLQGSGSTMNVDVPDSVAAGDIVVVTAFVDTSVTVTGLATDFAQAADSPQTVSAPSGVHSLYVMWKRATGSDSTAGTYDFTLSGSTYRNAQAIRYTGAVGSGDPWDVTNGAQSGNANDTVSPAVSDTTTIADTLLVWAATNWAGGTWTPPTDFTERRDSGDGVCTVADKAQAAAGATGSITGTCTGSDKRTAWLGALKASTSVFPVIETTNESAKTATTGTTHTVSLPTGIQSGDLLLALINKGRATAAWSFDALSGWTEILDEAVAGGCYVAYRWADGTEGATIDLTGAADRSAHITYRISGAANPATQAPEISTVATGTSQAPDPNTTTPTGGAKDYLWITFFGTTSSEEADDDTWTNNAATNYGSLLQKTSGTGGTNVAAGIASSTRTNNASSENAVWPASSIDTSMGWRAFTIAVHPASSATSASAGNAAGTGAANQPAVSIQASAGLATATGSADPPIAAVKPNAAATTVTGAANPPTAALRANAGVGDATGIANQPTVDVGAPSTDAPAGLAAATGTAPAPTVSIAAQPPAPTGAGAANQPTITLRVNAGPAATTGTAPQPTVQTGAFANAPAGSAAVTGTAFAPTIAVRAPAGAASGTGAANQPAASLGLRAGAATGAGTASPATIAVGALPPAGLAAGTATANQPIIDLRVLAGVASAAGTAPQAVGRGDLPVERISDPLTLAAAGPDLTLSTVKLSSALATAGPDLTLLAVDAPLTLEALED